MINVSGNLTTDLYTRNMIGELFPEFCFSSDKSIDCLSTVTTDNDKITAVITVNGHSYTATEILRDHATDRLATTTAIGKAVINYATAQGKAIPPYGVLTGVRPFKIAIDLLGRYDYDDVTNILKNVYLVSYDKAELMINVAMFDQMVRSEHKYNDASVYISIPFCPSRCNYCSFISSAAPSKLSLIDSYVDELACEIEQVSKLIEEQGINVKSIYVGGGTPTTLTAQQLDRLLSYVNSAFDTKSLHEYTVEAGRPDTIDEYKLDVMKRFGVTRTCINCQSTNNDVLRAIGRNHTAEDFFKAYEIARKYGFHTINTDIIAGLESESFESFSKTVDDVLQLFPESVTVHTLCVKKSADLKTNNIADLEKNIDDYITYSSNECIGAGFLPYYLYKQKYSLGNHENVGYCQRSHYSHYNIAMMNEIENIFGIGAGATSRLIGYSPDGKIQHFANYKYPTEYIGGSEKVQSNISEIRRIITST